MRVFGKWRNDSERISRGVVFSFFGEKGKSGRSVDRWILVAYTDDEVALSGEKWGSFFSRWCRFNLDFRSL
jgi:hypothetical protein